MILASEDKPKTPEDFDKIVCAEIPDKNLQPLLYETVSKNMVHGPCGNLNPKSQCMENGKCSKHYHKEFTTTTLINKFGYPIYWRRDNGRTIKKGQYIINNRWIVSYNLYLCQKYNCHINVEIYLSIWSIKYLYKYIYKRSDRAIIKIGNPKNEIEQYINARYVSAIEACWRLFNFGLQERSHKVERLPVHLEDQQSIIVNQNEQISTVLAKSFNTKLTRYFDMCNANQDDPDIMNLWYIDFLKIFV